MYQYFNNMIIMIISVILIYIELYTRAQKNIPRLIP